jgi:hypothetical protein
MLGIVAGSEVDSPSAGVQLSAKPFRNAALAKGRLAQGGAAAVGGVFQDVADKIQENRNARQVFDADLAMRKTYDNFTAQMVNMPDEGTWLPAWKEQTQALRDQILDNPHLGPDVKNQLSMKMDGWEEATTAATNTAALLKGHTESRKSAIADATYAANQGHVDGPGGANTIMDAAVANHAFSPEEAARLKKVFPLQATEANANQAIQRFPIEAPKILPTLKGWDTLEPDRKRVMLHVATEAMRGQQAANLDQWSDKLDDSPDHALDKSAFKKDLDSGQISQKGYDSVLTRQKRLVDADQKQASLEDRNEALLTMLDITNANAVGSKDPKAQKADFTDRINGITDPALRLRATKMLDEKFTAAEKEGASAEKPVHREQLDFMKQDFEQGTAFVPMTNGKPATSKWFGLSSADAEPPEHVPGGINGLEKKYREDPDQFHEDFGKDDKLDDVIEAARLNYATKQQAYLDWSKSEKGQNATPEEAANERKRLERPDAMSAAKDQATRSIPKEISSEEDFNALQPGDSFIFNGRMGVKN